MPVILKIPNTHGLLHGAANVVLAETLGSVAASHHRETKRGKQS